MRLTSLILILAPCAMSSCSMFDYSAYSEERTNEKMRAFARGGREESSAERDSRLSREAISAHNRHLDSGLSRPRFDP
jgi:hypothetical protein